MRIPRETFDHLVEAAIASLPQEYARWLDEVPVIVEDRPTAADLKGLPGPEDDEGDPVGMYIGRAGSLGELPPRVMLYREPLMEACDTEEQLAQEIRRTLLHEFGHHVGLAEDDLDRLGFGALDEDQNEDDIEWDVD
jgi:predicted Zn-dependent protease with MMP-like domain